MAAFTGAMTRSPTRSARVERRTSSLLIRTRIASIARTSKKTRKPLARTKPRMAKTSSKTGSHPFTGLIAIRCQRRTRNRPVSSKIA